MGKMDSEKKSLIRLLECKDADIRIDTLNQCKYAVDGGIHIGGAYSSIIPLLALYYGGVIDIDVEHPYSQTQDVFILSKGHAVASMASVYADLGYFDSAWLKNSRSYESLLNGHPGPIMPGVLVSTGPLGQGLSVSCGFATDSKRNNGGDIFCLLGDGELQEGSNWEGFQYAPVRKLDNICTIIDKNDGQSDSLKGLVIPLGNLRAKLEAFGWRVYEVDGTGYGTVLEAYEHFKDDLRDGRPTAIICNSSKGYGGFSEITCCHKSNIPADILEQELLYQQNRRAQKENVLIGMSAAGIEDVAARMNYRLIIGAEGHIERIERIAPAVRIKRALPRKKKVAYNKDDLPKLKVGEAYMCDDVVKRTIRVFARDERVYSIDSDLSTTSGLLDGVAQIDRTRALNAGIAESHMMCMGEALAAWGANVWMSTFCTFFDWRAFRRIAVSQQERLQAMSLDSGWLSQGYALDITFLATAPNFETQTNGATHMGNDDICVYGEIAHVKVIDICCPQQLISAMEWIAEGDKGLVYLRVPRMKTQMIYDTGYAFEFGRGFWLRKPEDPRAIFVSSGRAVHEALAAAQKLHAEGLEVAVIDMPSADRELFIQLAKGKAHVVFAEHNNGYLANEFSRAMLYTKTRYDPAHIHEINALENGSRCFIHSGTYGEITRALSLDADGLAAYVKSI